MFEIKRKQGTFTFQVKQITSSMEIIITVVEENFPGVISACKQRMQEQVNPAWINPVSKQIPLTLLESSAVHPLPEPNCRTNDQCIQDNCSIC